MKEVCIFLLVFVIPISLLLAQVPADYYDSAFGLTGQALKDQLYDIIDNNTNTDYGESREQMYGYIDNHNNTVQCVYTGLQVSHNYGNTSAPAEINCEHTYCQSWYSGIAEESIAKADLHHLFPTKMTVNSARGNLPLDNVANIGHTYSELTGYESYRGTNTQGVEVFEPADTHKGDAARALLYFAVRYEKGLTHGSVDMITTLINWHDSDLPDSEEITRNDDIYNYQGNANPFVNHPEFVDSIWGDNPVDTTPPEIENITIQSEQKIIVNFSEAVEANTSENTSNYSINNSIGNPMSANRGVNGNNARVILNIATMTRGENYFISIDEVEDLSGNIISLNSEKEFMYLAAGDVVLLGMNSDNNDEGYDDFAFMPMRNILAGTEIRFTDCGWKNSGEFRDNEGTVKFTAPENIAAGTVLSYYNNLENFWDDNSDYSGYFALSTSGDQILMFQGHFSTPSFIYALNDNGSAEWQSDATSSNSSSLPNQLTDGSTALAVQEYDNVAYDGGNTFNSPSLCLNAVSDKDNWVGDNTNRYDFVTFFTDFTFPLTLPAPGNVVITNVSEVINLSWNSVPGATHYKIYGSQLPFSEFSVIDTVTDTVYIDNTDEDNYFYKVKAAD
ncbi:MAG: endonuclease [Candidatus Cloacimonetes bacterium]|nr:endonuclease [Candidatus Cloacimonadota bacterium]MBS3768492.1 endonuclease [Candidatus Cloacimonadota bacterium]